MARTHAVGKLGLIYTDGTNNFVATFGLLVGEDPFNPNTMASYAATLAPSIAAILPPSKRVVGWRSFDTNLVEALSAPLATEQIGNHETVDTYPIWQSFTTCFTGATEEPKEENRIQQTRVFFNVNNTILVTGGEKLFPVTDDVSYQELADVLNTSTHFFSDRDGRKALARNYITIQFNAFLEHQRGS